MIEAPSYPLSREAFRRAIKAGHGRTLVHVRRFGAGEVREEILDAATHCKTYDAQIEGYRIDWLAPLCAAVGVVDTVIAQSPSQDDFRDREMRAQLLAEFARLGNARARQSLYDECEMAWAWGSINLFGGSEIIKLDGKDGLIFVARKLGEIFVKRPDTWIDDEPMTLFDDVQGKGSAAPLLEGIAPQDDLVVKYLEGVRKSRENSTKSHTPTTPHGEDLVTAIVHSQEPLYIAHSWGRGAQPDDIKRMLEIASTRHEAQVVENALRYVCGAVRSRAVEPPMHPAFFELVRHESAMIRLQASNLLGRHVTPEVRKAGLNLLPVDTDTALALLELNALAEDGDAIVRALKPIDKDEAQHSVVRGLVDLFDNAHVREPQFGMYVYAYSPCMNCRYHAVKYLLRLDACPDWIREECGDDASSDVRDLFDEKH